MKDHAVCAAIDALGWMMNLRVSFPPATGNTTTRINHKTKRFYTLPKIKAYRNSVLCDVLKANMDKPFTGPVSVKVTIVPPDKRRRDSGNIIKVLYDALTRAGLWDDDSLVREEHITWGEPCKPGYIDMEVTDAVSVSSSAAA